MDELEKYEMIKTVRHRGKTPNVSVLCDYSYEEYPTIRTHTNNRITAPEGMVKAWEDYELKILSSFLLILKSMIMRVGNLTLLGPWVSHLSITSGKKALITHRLKDLEVLKKKLGNNTIAGDNICLKLSS